jgi:hypothetical protein
MEFMEVLGEFSGFSGDSSSDSCFSSIDMTGRSASAVPVVNTRRRIAKRGFVFVNRISPPLLLMISAKKVGRHQPPRFLTREEGRIDKRDIAPVRAFAERR